MNAAALVVKLGNSIVGWIGNFTWRAPLDGCSREDWIQARCDGVLVPARTDTSLPRWSPHPSFWCCSSPRPSTICHLELSHYASLSTQHVRLSGVRLCRPGTRCLVNLEILTVVIVFTARQHSLLCRALISYSKCVCASVRLSVRLSHAGTVPKWLKLLSHGLYWRIAPWLLSFFTVNVITNIQHEHKERGLRIRQG